MPPRLALKRLTASDLTFFEWHYLNKNAGNQKAINLNADVLITLLYPSLPGIADQTHGRIPLDLSLYGPGQAGQLNVQRKIIKGQTYKNWRLDGEFVANPTVEPDRFNVLEAGDFALFSFTGEPAPFSAKLLLVAANHPDDAALHASLFQHLGELSMAEVAPDDLLRIESDAHPPQEHPFHLFTIDDALEDAALGGIQGIDRLMARPPHARITRQDLDAARENARRVGREGEALVNAYLHQLVAGGALTAVEWVSDTNAVSPHDFAVSTTDGRTILIEVKSTELPFDAAFHLSFGEFRQASSTPHSYHLYRLYDLYAAAGTAHLRICQDLSAAASRVMAAAASLGDSIRPDSFSIFPAGLMFGQELAIAALAEPDE